MFNSIVSDLFAVTGLVLTAIGASVNAHVSINHRWWLDLDEPPFPRLRRWRSGRTTLIEEGEITEDDYGFSEIKRAVQRTGVGQKNFT